MKTQFPPLMDILNQIPDPRQPKGKRYSLSSILALVCMANMCGYKSYSTVSEWGKNYGSEMLKALGFRPRAKRKRLRPPCAATLNKLFRRLELKALESKLSQWAEQLLALLPPSEKEEGEEAFAIDGKTLRGSQKQGASICHLLSLVGHRLGLTLIQETVDKQTNEIPIAEEVLKGLMLEGRLKGRIFTMDAILTQRSIAQTIIEGEGDYLMYVKENQARLLEDIQLMFEDPTECGDTKATAQTTDIGHGRIETRRITTSDGLVGYSDWPGFQQVFKLERHVTFKKSGKETREVVYGVTSLSQSQSQDRDKADASRLLNLTRNHWTIENKSHWVRDVTYDEDRSQVRCGSIPQVMATMRNLAIGLMRLAGESKIASACRKFAAKPYLALALMGISLEK